jgi:hypothetical protein
MSPPIAAASSARRTDFGFFRCPDFMPGPK